jgi:DEAD/DEAH box helicase domain-containing protein
MLHQGETYVVSEMDLDQHVVRVTPTEVDYYTQPLKEVDLSILKTLKTRTIQGASCFYGDVEVREQYTGYKIKRGDTIIGVEPLSLPPLSFRTKAFWIVPTPLTEQNFERGGLDPAGGLHGAEHAIIAMMPLHVMCDRWDIGGLSSASFGDSGEPVIFVYDGYEGGIGLAEKAFETLPDLLKTSWELVRDCGCEVGCPSCIYSPKCGNDNQPLDKMGTVVVLRDLCTAVSPEAAAPAGTGIPDPMPVTP